MKNRELLAQEYANLNFEHYSYPYSEGGELTDYDKIEESFLAGYNAAEENMKQITAEIQANYKITSIIYAFRQLIKRMKDGE